MIVEFNYESDSETIYSDSDISSDNESIHESDIDFIDDSDFSIDDSDVSTDESDDSIDNESYTYYIPVHKRQNSVEFKQLNNKTLLNIIFDFLYNLKYNYINKHVSD